jgi:hypothetical protein
MLRVVGRPVNRSDIQNTVLDISEQCCVGKLCSIHLAYIDVHGVAHPKTLAIAGYISEELDAAKTGLHPLTPKEIMQLQAELGNDRPDYFDKPYYKLYPSKHVLGKIFKKIIRIFLFMYRFQDNYFVHLFVSNPIGRPFKLHRLPSVQHKSIHYLFMIYIMNTCHRSKN